MVGILPPVPRDHEALDRFALDRVARAVVSGRRGYGRRIDALADAVASRMKNALEAAEAPGLRRAARLGVRPFADRRLLGLLVARTGKHLASIVVSRTPRARAHPA